MFVDYFFTDLRRVLTLEDACERPVERIDEGRDALLGGDFAVTDGVPEDFAAIERMKSQSFFVTGVTERRLPLRRMIRSASFESA